MKSYWEKSFDHFINIQVWTVEKSNPKNNLKMLIYLHKECEHSLWILKNPIKLNGKIIPYTEYMPYLLEGRDRVISLRKALSENERQTLTSLFHSISNKEYFDLITPLITKRHSKESDDLKYTKCPSCKSIIANDNSNKTFWPCPNCDFDLIKKSKGEDHCDFVIKYSFRNRLF